MHGFTSFAVDEMYLASLINKGREVYKNGNTDPTALPSETVLKMATINGAKSVLWDNEIGSLEVGKKVELFGSDDFLSSFCFISSVAKSSALFKFTILYCPTNSLCPADSLVFSHDLVG